MRRPADARRPALTVLVATAIVWLVPGSASAKGPGFDQEEAPSLTAVISGPGMGGPLMLSGERVEDLLYLSSHRGNGVAEPEPPAPDALGAAYRVSIYVLSGGSTTVIHQELYPYAEGTSAWSRTDRVDGAVTSGDADAIAFEIDEGWWHSSLLRTLLQRWGLPKAAPAEKRVDRPALDPGPSDLTGVWIAIAGFLVLLAAGLLGRRAAISTSR